jgi:hypothetical protein
MLLELFDKVFANEATELTYRVRNAIVDKDAIALGQLLGQNTAMRDELRRHIEAETDLLEAIQDSRFAVLRMALGIPEQETAPVEPAAPAPAPAPVEPAPAPAPAPAPFDAAAKAQALVSLKAQALESLKAQALESLKDQERVDGIHQEFVREVSKLNAEQLEAVLESENSLLIGVLPIEIQQIIQGKDVSFRATLLKHLFPNALLGFLMANSGGEPWGRMETIFAGMNRDQVVPILAKVSIIQEDDAPCPRLTVIQHLPQNIREQLLRGVTPDQREALLHGWGNDDADEHKAQLEALLTQADQ